MASGHPEAPDGFDPLDEQHYTSVAAFVSLLRTLGYHVGYDDTDWVEIHLDARVHPLEGYTLATYVNEAMSRGLFNAELVGTGSDGDPLEVTLRWETFSADADNAPIPLYKRAEYPVDYFAQAEGLTRILLRYDLDSPDGVAFTSHLQHNSSVYVDEAGIEGPLSALEGHLRESGSADLPAYEAAYHSDDPAALKPFWLDYFDMEFDLALGAPEEYVIVQCVGPHDQGYIGDRMFFLVEREMYNLLEVPLQYRVELN